MNKTNEVTNIMIPIKTVMKSGYLVILEDKLKHGFEHNFCYWNLWRTLVIAHFNDAITNSHSICERNTDPLLLFYVPNNVTISKYHFRLMCALLYT